MHGQYFDYPHAMLHLQFCMLSISSAWIQGNIFIKIDANDVKTENHFFKIINVGYCFWAHHPAERTLKVARSRRERLIFKKDAIKTSNNRKYSLYAWQMQRVKAYNDYIEAQLN